MPLELDYHRRNNTRVGTLSRKRHSPSRTAMAAPDAETVKTFNAALAYAKSGTLLFVLQLS